jgi:flagellar biosynthesis protein FliR
VTFDLDPALLSGYLLALVRAGAWIAVTPPFGTKMLPPLIKIGFAASLALALGPQIAEQNVPLDPGSLIVAAVLQIAAGLILGFLAMMLFSAVQAAGGLIDLMSGLTMATVFDPFTASTSSIFGRFYNMVAITLLFAINGHVMLVRGFLTSYTAAPFTNLDFDTIGQILSKDFALFFVAAVEIALPLLAALFLADVALALLSRAAPQMNVFVVGMPLKVLLAITLAGLALPLLPNAVNGLLTSIVRDGRTLMGAG